MEQEEVIARIRDRIQQLRKVLRLSHDPRIIKLIEEVIAKGEADIQRLEVERAGAGGPRGTPTQD